MKHPSPVDQKDNSFFCYPNKELWLARFNSFWLQWILKVIRFIVLNSLNMNPHLSFLPLHLFSMFETVIVFVAKTRVFAE